MVLGLLLASKTPQFLQLTNNKTIKLSVAIESNICMFLFANVFLGLSKASFMHIHGFHKG